MTGRTPPALAESLRQTVIGIHGDRGRDWLGRLPETIQACEKRWNLRAGPPLDGLSINYVAPVALADGGRAILKLGVPLHELTSEIEALRVYEGRGAVKLLASDPEVGALLLEKVAPGEMLRHTEDDEAATQAAADVMARLWRPAPKDHPFVTVEHWSMGLERLRARFDNGTGPLDGRLVDRAEGIFGELIASSGPPVVLHGDLHHDNILRATREPWLAIDPKGVVGEREYEPGAFLRNPHPFPFRWTDPAGVLDRRIAVFAERLGFDRTRIRMWAMAQAVLAAWWSVEDNGSGAERFMACAELLDGLES